MLRSVEMILLTRSPLLPMTPATDHTSSSWSTSNQVQGRWGSSSRAPAVKLRNDKSNPVAHKKSNPRATVIKFRSTSQQIQGRRGSSPGPPRSWPRTVQIKFKGGTPHQLQGAPQTKSTTHHGQGRRDQFQGAHTSSSGRRRSGEGTRNQGRGRRESNPCPTAIACGTQIKCKGMGNERKLTSNQIQGVEYTHTTTDKKSNPRGPTITSKRTENQAQGCKNQAQGVPKIKFRG